MAIERIKYNTNVKAPYKADVYSDTRGITDYANAFQFAPYESGYAFLVVFGVPKMMNLDNATDGRKDLLEVFVSILEKEFKSFNGISDITGSTIETSNGYSSVAFINKTERDTSVNWSVNVTEKEAAPITTFISRYLKYICDPNSGARTYGGMATRAKTDGNAYDASKIIPSRANEIFTIGIGFLDSTMLHLQKGFILANSQPTTANYSDIYEYTKGSNDSKDITIQFIGYLCESDIIDDLLQSYVDAIMNNSPDIVDGAINLNSQKIDNVFGGSDGNAHKFSEIFGPAMQNNKIADASNVYSTASKTYETKFHTLNGTLVNPQTVASTGVRTAVQ